MKSAAVVAALASAAVAAPFSFPLPNGFPSPNDQAVALIQLQAGGTLPNTALPKSVSPDIVTSLQLIAANEIFEVAYFTELYNNITNNVPGYELKGEPKDYIAGAIFRIRAQEELHALGANAILQSVGEQPIAPCKYTFPVSDFKSAIALANTFTDVVLGVLPAVQYLGGTSGGKDGAALIPLIGSIEEQEAQQVGWFRTLQGKFPSAAPFLAPTTPQFALSAVSMFLVPGSCPAAYSAIQKKVASFPPLSATIDPVNSKATFSLKGNVDSSKQALAYISGQNKPVTVPIQNPTTKNGVTSFTASFPFTIKGKTGFAGGLTVATVVSANREYANATDVAANTLYGPGLIEFL